MDPDPQALEILSRTARCRRCSLTSPEACLRRKRTSDDGRLRTTRCNFLGRVDAFRDLARDYDLVINPSWMETFGMAAIEVLAAGVPLLSSRTGCDGSRWEADEMLFAPSRPDQLAFALKRLLREWPKLDLGATCSQGSFVMLLDSQSQKCLLSDRRLRQVVGRKVVRLTSEQAGRQRQGERSVAK